MYQNLPVSPFEHRPGVSFLCGSLNDQLALWMATIHEKQVKLLGRTEITGGFFNTPCSWVSKVYIYV